MAGKEDKLEALTDIYMQEVRDTEIGLSDTSTESVSKSEQLIDDSYEDVVNRLTLRSGLSYPTPSVAVPVSLVTCKPINTLPVTTMANPTVTTSTATTPTSSISQPQTSMSTQASSQHGAVFPSTVRVLPTAASIKPFSGNDADYTASQYLIICEDVMRNSDIYRPGDMIAFVRSRVQPGTRAMTLLQGMALSPREIGDNYDKFKQNFLKVFCDGAASTVVKQANLLVDSVSKDLENMDIMNASVPAETHSVGAIRILREAGWVTGNHIDLDRLQKFLGLQYFLLHVDRRARRAADTLSFKVTDQMVDFMTLLQSKVNEGTSSEATSAIVAGVTPPAQVNENPTAQTGAVGKQRVVCLYCNKVGHVEKKCLKKRADLRKGTGSAKDNAMEGNLSVRPKHHSPSRGGGSSSKSSTAKTTGQWHCVIHGTGNHSSDRCFTIKRVKEELEQNKKGDTGKSSGEGARSASNRPG